MPHTIEDSWILQEREQDSRRNSEPTTDHNGDVPSLDHSSYGVCDDNFPKFPFKERTRISAVEVSNTANSYLSNTSTEPVLIMPTIKTEGATPSKKINQQASLRQRVFALKKSNSDHQHVPMKVKRSAAKVSQESTPAYAPLKFVSFAWSHFALPLIQFVSSVLALLYRLLRPILVFLVAMWIIGFVGRLLVRRTMLRALSPLCFLPGSAHLSSICATTTDLASSVEFDELMTVQAAFEDVLASSASRVNVPLEMKRGEASIRDLKHIVQYSALPSRNELVFEFTGFIETARQASTDLTKFNSRIGRAVDRVIGVNRWTLQVIDGVAEKKKSRGAVNRFMQETLLVPFFDTQATERLVLEQYLEHTHAVEEQIAELIVEAQALLAILQNLDDRLDVIQSISTRDGVSLAGNRDEILVQLWTWVGGNRASIKKNREQKALLNQVNVYRKTAWEHVTSTILKLQSIANGLEDLRERMGAPNVLGISAVSLRLHIEHIQMGVERLEERRVESRKIEDSSYRALLD